MLSYRHAYHAGNFADVMKHLVLSEILEYLTRKEAPLCYIDSHAGAGGYDLRSNFAQKTRESHDGIVKLWNVDGAPEAVQRYLDLVGHYNSTQVLTSYPGSPWIAAQLLRTQDRLVLCEMHTSDFPVLEKNFSGDRRVRCHLEDSYHFTLGLVPPLERRGLVFMDPAFEVRGEHQTAVATIEKLYRKFATGTYALWYPILEQRSVTSLREIFQAASIPNILNLEFRIADHSSHTGMIGCGMVVINPPWTLSTAMDTALPWLVTQLGLGKGAKYAIDTWAKE